MSSTARDLEPAPRRRKQQLVGAALSALLLLSAASTRASDVLVPMQVVLDPPTLVTLGVQLLISGDDDHDATVTVRFRALREESWHQGMPLFRVRPETIATIPGHPRGESDWARWFPEQFAGSIFGLAPATTYEIELHATDPDGPVDQTFLVQATTRAIPGDPASPTPKIVSDAPGLQAALDVAVPGDVITIAPGTYQRVGQFKISRSGTPGNPIVVRGSGTEDTVLDGGGCQQPCNVLTVNGSFVHVERLTLQSADTAIRFGSVEAVGDVLRRVHVRDVRFGVRGVRDQRDFYLCDNVLEGRLSWPFVYPDNQGANANDAGILVDGTGHVVCHNQLFGFGDGLKTAWSALDTTTSTTTPVLGTTTTTTLSPPRAIDFYGNEVLTAYDDGLELDRSAGNVRAFRNRFTNTYDTVSLQPVYGGPVYVMRNVVVNVVNEELKLHNSPSGAFVLHNTFVRRSPALVRHDASTTAELTIENNLFIGSAGAATARVADWSGPIVRGVIDANGWYPDGRFLFGNASLDWPSFAAMQAGGRFEADGVLLGAGPFASGLTGPDDPRITMDPQDVALAEGGPAVDHGRVVPNVDDDFMGVGPDLGALEVGCPEPIFGPRPEGVDETNEPIGCSRPVVSPTTTTTSSTTSTTSTSTTSTSASTTTVTTTSTSSTASTTSTSTSLPGATTTTLPGDCDLVLIGPGFPSILCRLTDLRSALQLLADVTANAPRVRSLQSHALELVETARSACAADQSRRTKRSLKSAEATLRRVRSLLSRPQWRFVPERDELQTRVLKLKQDSATLRRTLSCPSSADPGLRLGAAS